LKAAGYYIKLWGMSNFTRHRIAAR